MVVKEIIATGGKELRGKLGLVIGQGEDVVIGGGGGIKREE